MASHTDLKLLFDSAPIGWEDYSLLKNLFDQWRSRGSHQPKLIPFADPRRVQAVQTATGCCGHRYLVNLRPGSQDEMINRLGEALRGDTYTHMLPELLAFWQGQLQYSGATELRAGRPAHGCPITFRIWEGHEDT